MEPGQRSSTRFDGRSILLIAILTGGLTGPGQTIGVSVFIDHFVDDLELSRSSVSTAYLIGTLTGATVLPFVGRFVDRRGVRLAQIIVGLLFSLALVNMSFVGGVVTLTVGFVGIRMLGQGSLSLIAGVTVALRFRNNRGTALGVHSVGQQGLMALVPVALAATIAAVGWRTTWLIAAAVVAVTVVPLAWLGLRTMPIGQTRNSPSPDEEHGPSVPRGAAMRTRGFWILVAVSGAAGMLTTALNFHQIDLLGDAGLSSGEAAAMFVPQVVGSTVAGIGFGRLIDRVGGRWLPAASMLILAAAHGLAAVVGPGISVLLYAATLGATGGSVNVVTKSLLPEWFGTRWLGEIQGSLTLFNVGASALGPLMLAVSRDAFDRYPPAVLLLGAIPLACAAFALLPPNVRHEPRFSERQSDPARR